MRILAGIPTRLRDTSGRIADVLAEAADEVLVVSQGATVRSSSSKVIVHEVDVDYGLVKARNHILTYAIAHGFDVVIQSDDDLRYKADIIEALTKEVVDNPTLGAVASSSRAYFNWGKDVECTKNFHVTPCAPQLWASRTEILQEIGPWHLEYLEDREHGIRMWKAGYAIGLLHLTLDMTHNPFIYRTNAKPESGGQDKSINRREKLGEAIDYMMTNHADVVTLKLAKPDQKRTFTSRHRWNALLQYPINRFGYALGYEDSKGKRL